MACVTISRQVGSLGGEVAGLVAQQLGYQVVWREVINEAARRAGAPEVALAAIDDLGLFGLHPPAAAVHAYHLAVRQVMEELAAQGGVVIIGRAGQSILSGRPDVLHVRLIAPAWLRAHRLSRRKNIPLEAAAAHIEISDQSRRRYLRRYYKIDWEDPQLYDLILNTHHLSAPVAAQMVCQAAQHTLLTGENGKRQ